MSSDIQSLKDEIAQLRSELNEAKRQNDANYYFSAEALQSIGDRTSRFRVFYAYGNFFISFYLTFWNSF